MFPLDWAGPFGIDQAACTVEDCNTVGGIAKKYIYPPGLDAKVAGLGWDVHLNASFSAGLAVVILGRHDFFNTFKTSFDQRAQTFTLEPY